MHKRPLKIVHTESSCGWGGQEIRILTEAEGMVKRGHQLTLLCPQEAPIYSEAERRGLPVVALAHCAQKNFRRTRTASLAKSQPHRHHQQSQFYR